MYTLAFILLSPFWSGVFANTPARVIAAAAVVSVLVQFLKTYFPQFITGKTTMIVNLLGSIAGVLAFIDPAHFWSVATLQQIVVVFSGAAGLHATARGLFPKDQPANDPTPGDAPNPLAVAPMLIGVLLLGLASLTGCKTAAATTPATAPTLPHFAVDQVDAKANQTLQAIHAFLLSVSTDVQAGKVQLSAEQLTALNKTNALTNQADAAEQAYHQGGGGDASVLNAAMSAAQSAFGLLQASIASTVTTAK